jgi:hypothetical protein
MSLICSPPILINTEYTRQVDVPRPAHQLNLAPKLKDAANTSAPELSFQCKAIQDFHSRQVQDSHPTGDNCLLTSSAPDSCQQSSSPASATSAVQGKHGVPSAASDDAEDITDQLLEQCVSFSKSEAHPLLNPPSLQLKGGMLLHAYHQPRPIA